MNELSQKPAEIQVELFLRPTAIPFIDLDKLVVHDAHSASDICLKRSLKRVEVFENWDGLLEHLFDIYEREGIKGKRLKACKNCVNG